MCGCNQHLVYSTETISHSLIPIQIHNDYDLCTHWVYHLLSVFFLKSLKNRQQWACLTWLTAQLPRDDATQKTCKMSEYHAELTAVIWIEFNVIPQEKMLIYCRSMHMSKWPDVQRCHRHSSVSWIQLTPTTAVGESHEGYFLYMWSISIIQADIFTAIRQPLHLK